MTDKADIQGPIKNFNKNLKQITLITDLLGQA